MKMEKNDNRAKDGVGKYNFIVVRCLRYRDTLGTPGLPVSQSE